jgi:hypothetical protein
MIGTIMVCDFGGEAFEFSLDFRFRQVLDRLHLGLRSSPPGAALRVEDGTSGRRAAR